MYRSRRKKYEERKTAWFVRDVRGWREEKRGGGGTGKTRGKRDKHGEEEREIEIAREVRVRRNGREKKIKQIGMQRTTTDGWNEGGSEVRPALGVP